MDKAKQIVSFAGVKHGDIVYYTARALSSCNRPVLVIDNSRQHDLFGSIWKSDKRDVVVRNITYVEDAGFSKDVLDDFQYIVVYHGTRIDVRWWTESDIRFVLTNFDRFDIDETARAFETANVETKGVVPVFVDRWSQKIKDRDVVESLGITVAEETPVIEVVPDETSAGNWLSFQYNGSQSLTKLSKEMQKSIYGIYKLISGKNSLPIKKAFSV